MSRFLKILGAVLGVVIVIGLLFLWLWDFSRYEPQIEAAVSEAIGREFRIDGNFEVDVLPSPTVLVEGASLANTEWGSEPHMITVGRAYVEVGFWSLLFQPIEIHRLELSDIDVLLESNADGEANWQFETAADASEEPPPEDEGDEVPFKLVSADISDVRIVLQQGDTEALELLLKSLVAGADESVGALAIDASFGSVAEVGKRFGVTNLPADDVLMTGNLALRGGALVVSDFRASLTGLELAVDGEFGADALQLTMAVTGERLDILDAGMPDIPFGVSGDITIEGTTIEVAPLDLMLGDSKVTGDLSFTGGDSPSIALNATSPMLDLRPFLPAEEAESPPEEEDEGEPDSPYVFPDKPLPFDTLNSLDTDVNVAIGELYFRNTQVNNFDLGVNLAGGDLVIENTFDGKYAGEYQNDIHLDASRNQADLTMDMVVKGLKLGMLSGSDIPVEQMPSTNVDIGLTATGMSPRALAASTNGKIVITQGPGRARNGIISNLTGDIIAQLFEALNPFAKEEEFTNWECSVVGMDFESGVGTMSGFLLQSEKLMIVAGGNVDLNDEKLDFEFNTKPREGVGVSADMFVTPFVKLTGTLADPSVGLNAKGMLLSGGAAVLTGGMSFLYKGLVDRATAEEGQCEEALAAAGTVTHSEGTE